MARRRYYRVKTTRPRWSYNTHETFISGATVPNSGFSVVGQSIVTNTPVDGATVASPVIKTGRFRVRGVINSTNENSAFIPQSTMIVALMFVPQGIVYEQIAQNIDILNGSIFYAHPEWIMGWTRYDYDNPGQRNEFSITSRLKRNLNRGDSIHLVCIVTNRVGASPSGGFRLQATTSYVCRTN